MAVEIPYNWRPRKYQMPAWDFFMRGGRYGMFQWHRRAGKDLFCINLICAKLVERPGVYWHVFPEREQAVKAIWEGDTKDGRKYLDYFPSEIIEHKYETQKMIKFRNGSIYRLVGADTDSLVGAGPVFACLSEFPLMGSSTWDYLEPMISEKEGSVCMIFTPRGKNHAVKLYNSWEAEGVNKGYFTQKLTIEDTRDETGIDVEEFLRVKRLNGMSESRIQSEYYCNSDASVEGAYFADVLKKIKEDGHIRDVPWETNLEVNTAWDLGVNDYTAIWFYQQYGSEIRFIDFYMEKDKGLEHYIKVVKDKPYVYGKHYAPHDIGVREYSAGNSGGVRGGLRTRQMIAKDLGIAFKKLNRVSMDDGIEHARSCLYRSYFDQKKCEKGLDCLDSYGRDWDDMAGTYRDNEKRNWATDAGAAFRYACQSATRYRDDNTERKRQTKVKQVYEYLH
jgi:hypothetical protein